MTANSSLVGSAPYGAWGKLVNPNPPAIPSQGVAHPRCVAVDVRDSFALNTCAGCHRHETDTRHFMHVAFVGAIEPSLDTGRNPIAIGSGWRLTDDGRAVELLARVHLAGRCASSRTSPRSSTKRVDLHDKPGLRACR